MKIALNGFLRICGEACLFIEAEAKIAGLICPAESFVPQIAPVMPCFWKLGPLRRILGSTLIELCVIDWASDAETAGHAPNSWFPVPSCVGFHYTDARQFTSIRAPKNGRNVAGLYLSEGSLPLAHAPFYCH